MKNVLLFVAIITVCGSLMRAPINRMCDTTIVRKIYSNGKITHISEEDNFRHTIGSKQMYTEWGWVEADSVIYEPKHSTYKMLK